MKLQSTLTACLLALGTVAAANAQEIKLNLPGANAPANAPAAAPAAPAAKPAAPAAAAVPAQTFTDEQLVETWGWIMARRFGIAELEFSKEQIAAMARGIVAASSGQEPPYDLTKAGPLMDEFMQKKQRAYFDKLKKAGMAETTAFMAEIKKKTGVVATGTGLAYEILKQGEGPSPKPTDIVKVHYTGALVNGQVFDSSVQRGEPADIGLDQVIPGWAEGLQKLSKGGKIKLYIPPHLAYGDEGKGNIPPSSTLIFEIELIDFKAAPAAPAPAGK